MIAAITKVLHVGYESDPKPSLTLDGTTIDVCDIYNCLGLPTLSSKASQNTLLGLTRNYIAFTNMKRTN